MWAKLKSSQYHKTVKYTTLTLCVCMSIKLTSAKPISILIEWYQQLFCWSQLFNKLYYPNLLFGGKLSIFKNLFLMGFFAHNYIFQTKQKKNYYNYIGLMKSENCCSLKNDTALSGNANCIQESSKNSNTQNKEERATNTTDIKKRYLQRS